MGQLENSCRISATLKPACHKVGFWTLIKVVETPIQTSAFPSGASKGMSLTAPGQTVIVTGLSNREFLERYARPGRVGLSGGVTLVDRAIGRAQRHLDPEQYWSCWSHAFLFQGTRLDRHQWVIESDLQVNRKHIRLGAQENRIGKYYDERLYSTLAVLEFSLTEEQVATLLLEALELVASRARYSLRELNGTLIALRH